MEKKTCPICGEEISTLAKKCPHCNEWIDETTAGGEKSTDNDVASTAYADQETAVNGIKYSKVMVSYMVFLSLFGMLLSFTEFGPKDLRELTCGVLPVIGYIMDGIGTCVLFCMFGMKIASESINGVSKGLVITTGISSAIIGIMEPIIESSDLVLVWLIYIILLIQCIVCWIIVGIHAIKVERLKKIGIWMFISVILEIAALIIIESHIISGKAMFKMAGLIYLMGYFYLYRNMKEYLCTSMRKI